MKAPSGNAPEAQPTPGLDLLIGFPARLAGRGHSVRALRDADALAPPFAPDLRRPAAVAVGLRPHRLPARALGSSRRPRRSSSHRRTSSLVWLPAQQRVRRPHPSRPPAARCCPPAPAPCSAALQWRVVQSQREHIPPAHPGEPPADHVIRAQQAPRLDLAIPRAVLELLPFAVKSESTLSRVITNSPGATRLAPARAASLKAFAEARPAWPRWRSSRSTRPPRPRSGACRTPRRNSPPR